MRHYPRIPEGQPPVDICSEVAPIIIHTVDQSQDVIPNHSQLTELDKPNQHPIEVIIGLKEELERLNNKEVIVEETDPTVPEWAKQPERPKYTAEEVGALAADTKIPTRLNELEEDDEHLTVSITEKKKWNSGTGTGGGFSGEYNDLLNKPTIPKALADLTDDKNHRTVTDEQIELWNKGGENVFSGSYNDLIDKPNIPTRLSELESDDEYLTVSAVEKVEWSKKISSQQNVEDANKIFTIDIDGKVILKTLTEVNSALTWGMLAGKS